MPATDNKSSYKKVKDKIQASQSFKNIKNNYDKIKKNNGDSFEESNDQVSQTIDKFKEAKKSFQRKTKSQFSQLLDINNLTGGKGKNSIKYVKRLLLRTLKNIEPKIREILMTEIFKSVGCDQNQTYNATKIYISVKSIDLFGLLKVDPSESPGNLLYEKDIQINPQPYPYSMNRQLYYRIQQGSTTSYKDEYGKFFEGRSGQALFNIKYVDPRPDTGENGGWFEVELKERVGVNKIGEFLNDYYQSIVVLNFQNIIVHIMNSLSGAVSGKLGVGIVQSGDATKFELIIQRIMGLCFDNSPEIDVSGVAKVAELDGVDNSFFEFSELDLRFIDQRISNIQNGVVEFEECDFIQLPINANNIISSLENLFFVEDDQLVEEAMKISDNFKNNPDWKGLALDVNLDVAVDFNFVQLMINGLISALLSPKVLLPIFIMLKSLGKQFLDQIQSYMDFAKKFSKFVINLISKIGAIFVQELFNLIKKDIVNLIQQIVIDVAREKSDKKIIMILKLTQLLLIVARSISDWRRCKSVIDELFQLLMVLTSGWGLGGGMPLPLLFASQFLDGYSESRAFIGTIEELQALGIPTGDMPDGSPNFDMLSKFAQMKAMSKEDAENGMVQVALPPLQFLPNGSTKPIPLWGKKF